MAAAEAGEQALHLAGPGLAFAPAAGAMAAVESLPDEMLVQRSQAGDRAAFEQLVRRTARLVYSRLYLEATSPAARDPHRIDDLVQETFLTAWRSIRQVSDPHGFRSWLLSVARTAAADAHRHASRKKRGGGGPGADLEVVAPHLADDGPTPAEAVEIEEGRRRVLERLNALPEEYRLPLTLRYIAGADYDTIGRQLGLSNGSLRGLLSRGMAKLREAMKEEGDGPR